MAGIIQRIGNNVKRRIVSKCKSIVSKLYSLLPLHYKSLHKIPFDRWHKAQNGELKYLNKYNFSYTPYFFYSLYVDLVYQMPVLSLETMRKRADMTVFYSMAARTGNKGTLFHADTLKKELENEQKNQIELQGLTIDEFIDVIELAKVVNYQVDPCKISASRAYSLFDKAKKKLKCLEKQQKQKNVKHS